MNVAELAERHVDKCGAYDAVLDGGRVWTSTVIHSTVSSVAAAFVERGIGPGARILIVLRNSVELIVAFTAALRSGNVAVPTFAGSTAHEIARLVADCAPEAIVTSADAVARDGAVFAHVPHRFCVAHESTAPVGWVPFDALYTHASLTRAVTRAGVDPAVICYTSGTRGAPKGVVYTHAGIRARHRTIGRSTPDTVLMALPLYTFGGWTLTGRLTAQWKIVLTDTFEPRAFLRAVDRHRVTTFPLVPSMGEALLAAPDLDEYDLSSVRRVTLTGAQVSPELVERLAAILPIVPSVGYSMTEAGGVIATNPSPSKPGSVGRIVSGVEVRIVDAAGQVVAPGQSGEIRVKTPWMARGYLQSAGDEAVFDDGWVRTGDLGRFDEDAELILIGRAKDQINQSGVKVQPTELVEIVQRLPEVRECAVVGVPHPMLGEEVVAFVVRTEPSLTEARIIDHCRHHLDPRKAPSRVSFVDALPRTPSGKVLVRELQQRVTLAANTTGSADFIHRLHASPPRRRLSVICDAIDEEIRRVLPNGTVSSGSEATSFAARGLDSIRLVQLADALGKRLGRAVSPALLFGHSSVEALGRRLLDDMVPSRRSDSGMASDTSGHRSLQEPIAIIGMACRMPGKADTPERFWSVLRNGVETSDSISRWNVNGGLDRASVSGAQGFTWRASLLETADLFDAEFFGMSDREALALDPQQRLALEVTWEALERAGYNPFALGDLIPGVFLGVSGSSYPSSGAMTTSPSMTVGRICHFLDLQGPAAVVDTACSSSLFAVHSSVHSLQRGECDIALAGGVNVIGSPRTFMNLSQLGTLSPDGRCKSFDAAADGYGRGEGCVIFVLKRLTDARRAGDHVFALVRGSASCHDGRSASLTAPNARAQQTAMLAAFRNANVSPDDLDYLETHGAGTPLGDRIEIESATAVFSSRTRALAIGSVKANIGHLEAAAGAAGMLKVVLALGHEEIPPHRQWSRVSPALEPLMTSVYIPGTVTPWRRSDERRRIAGVTSMGLSGTNVHVVIEEAPPDIADIVDLPQDESGDLSAELLCLAARTEDALLDHMHQHIGALEALSPDAFPSYCFTANAGRTHFPNRRYVVATSPADARERLRAQLSAPSSGIARRSPPKTAFLFTGHGSQYPGMCRQLYASEPVFRRAFQQCSAILEPIMRCSLVVVLYETASERDEAVLDDMSIAQPALFAVEWSICELWKSWGIEADVVLGHSLGECAAACYAGVLGLEDALTLSAARGRLMQSLPPGGAMMSVAASYERVHRAVAAFTDTVSIAALNGPQRTVISGLRDTVLDVANVLARDGVECRQLSIPRAGHSPLVDPILDPLEDVARRLRYESPRLDVASTLLGKVVAPSDMLDAHYWRRQMREPVRFSQAIESLVAAGCETFVEVGPHPVLIGMASDSVTSPSISPVWLGSVRRDSSDRAHMRDSLGQLYCRGHAVNWDQFYSRAARRVTGVPTYPFQHKSYWRGSTSGQVPSVSLTPEPIGNDVRSRAVSVADAPSAPYSGELVTDYVRRQVCEIVGRPIESLSQTENLLAGGLDSLRVLDLVSGVRRSFGVRCVPADLISNPDVSSFAGLIEARLRCPDGGVAASVPIPSQLVSIRPEGSRPPIFCMHPSGGSVSVYLRLAALVNAELPLYAIQSRARLCPESEHTAIDSMAVDYAALIERVRPGPCLLFGWSMGGMLAHAVAYELERRGTEVLTVGMVDSVSLTTSHGDDVRFALGALIHELNSSPPADDAIADRIGDCVRRGTSGSELLASLEAHGLVLPGAISASDLDATLQLYLRHFQLVRAHRPPVIAAPLVHWVTHRPHRHDPWADRSHGGYTCTSVGGTHFSVMQPRSIHVIAAGLSAAANRCAV
jgi:acyl transferase domain-containing protein/acyl-CoA synthetase (AMP-forming)/AMP-acid ligase II/thioesterase domain-containing protein/aryl carrier-like protein